MSVPQTPARMVLLALTSSIDLSTICTLYNVYCIQQLYSVCVCVYGSVYIYLQS